MDKPFLSTVTWNVKPLSILLDLESCGEIAHVPQLARFPSPAAIFGAKEAECVALVDKHASPAVRQLFHLIKERCETTSLRELMAADDGGLADDRKVGMLGYLAEAMLAEDHVSPREDWDVDRKELNVRRVKKDFFILRWGTPWVVDQEKAPLLALKRFIGLTASGSYGNLPVYKRVLGIQEPVKTVSTKPIDFKRLAGKTAEGRDIHGFFLVNLSGGEVKVNHVGIDPERIAGPLPDFAIIEFGEGAAFWWHTRGARSYFPPGTWPGRPRVFLGRSRARRAEVHPVNDVASQTRSKRGRQSEADAELKIQAEQPLSKKPRSSTKPPSSRKLLLRKLPSSRKPPFSRKPRVLHTASGRSPTLL